MKNLELLELVYRSTQNTFLSTNYFAQTFDSVYFLKEQILHKFNFVENSSIEVCPLTFDNVVCVKVLSIERKICVATSDTLYIIDPDGPDEIKIINFNQNDIAEVSWNPTEELVVTVSYDGQVSTFNVDYENGDIFPQGSSTVNVQVPDTVYVGWGSKDTQFRGSEGKLKRDETTITEKPVEERKPSISWRGNGEMFVVNYWTQDKRKFVVFSTPCTALYRSEDCPGLQCPIAWRPVGNMVATLTNISDKQSIVIFEKNGQKRFNIDLDIDQEIKEIKWSPCAQILTLYSVSDDSQCLHLFTSSNYKWYEKQRLVFSTDNALLDFNWLESSQFTYTLRVVTRNNVINYTFHSVINNNLYGTCAVINGNILQLTDFKDAIIPPVLCSRKIINDNSILSVSLNEEFVVIVDCANVLKVFNLKVPETPLVVLKLTKIDFPNFPLSCHHFVSKGKDVYFAVESDDEKKFYHFNVQTNELKVVGATKDALRHLLIIPEDSKNSVNIEHITGTLFMNSNSLPTSIKEVVAIVGDKYYNCQLTSNCWFYINEDKIADSVNSFIIFDHYLLYTTKLNELHCIKLTDGLDKTYRRNIEQGANIIVAIPNSPKIVLQLPRGNLETISCRLVSIDILDRLLSEGEWKEALRFVRLEKLNSNLLFDLSPDRFLNQIDRFIEAATTVNELNAICLEFEEENVLAALYQKQGKTERYLGKISAIFDKLFKYFDKGDYAPYINTLMIVNLRFFTLREALIYLEDLLKRTCEDPALRKSLVDAVNTLKTYGCDQEKLYSESLLLYDLELARFIAGCCQMDPRQYEPHLKNLLNLGEARRRYEINLFAKRPKIAVAYLLRCPEVTSEELLKFIKTYKVSREAYESCWHNSEHYQMVSGAFAEELSKMGRHQEAGVVLKRAGLLKEALEEFKAALRWREALNVMEELRVDEVQKRRILNEMAGKLSVNTHTIQEAAILYEYYVDNYEMAVKVLIDNCKFEDAVHVAKKHARKDIIVSEIIPALMKYKNNLHEKIGYLDESYIKYKTRLSQVRQMKAAKFSNNITYDEYHDKGDDLFSDAGSVITKSSRSSRSRSSTASSRNRRKEEKKKQDLREGGIYEDIALIRVLHSTIKEVYNIGDEVRNCCLLLMEEGDVSFKEIKKFYHSYKKIYNSVQEGMIEIWPPHFRINNQTQEVKELADLENLEHLDVEFRTPPDVRYWNRYDLNLFGD